MKHKLFGCEWYNQHSNKLVTTSRVNWVKKQSGNKYGSKINNWSYDKINFINAQINLQLQGRNASYECNSAIFVILTITKQK